MKKLLISISFLFSFFISFSQPIVNRTTGANTVIDPRLGASKNFYLPRYTDTTQANLSVGIDSCSAIIYTYSNNAIWKRSCSPKRWEILGGGVASRFGIEDNLGLQNRYFNGKLFNLIIDSLGLYQNIVVSGGTTIITSDGDGIFLDAQNPDGGIAATSFQIKNDRTVGLHTTYSNVPVKFYLTSSDSLKIASPTRIAVWDADTLKSASATSLRGPVANGITLAGDTTMLGGKVNRYTYIEVPNREITGSYYGSIILGNNPEAQSINGSLSPWQQKNIYGASLFGGQKYFRESLGDTDRFQYGAIFVTLARKQFDSTSTRFKAGVRNIRQSSQGLYSVYQFLPPRDSVVLEVGRDGESGEVGHFQFDLGDSYGYKIKVNPDTGSPEYPMNIVLSSMDYMRVIDNTRVHKVYGQGWSNITTRFKTYQTAITGSTYEAGNYVGQHTQLTLYGDAYSDIGSATTKDKINLVFKLDTSIGMKIRPLWASGNTAYNGIAIWAQGANDYSHFNGYMTIGGNLPTRDNAGQIFRYRLYTTGKGWFTDSLHGFIVAGVGLSAEMPKSIGDEVAMTLSQKDSAYTGIIGAYMPTSRDGRGLYIRSEGYSAAVYPNTSTGFAVQIETGANHAFVTRWWRNGNMVVNVVPAVTDQYRLYKKFLVNGTSLFLDTVTIKNIPIAPAGDTTNYFNLGITSNGDVFRVSYGSGGASGLTVGTTTIASGTTTRILYDNAGVLGEYTISGSGNVAMTTSPAFTTPILGTPTSGTLTNTTGYLWNNLANPTGTQTLTFDDGKLNAWTISSDAETFHTYTANSLTSGIGILMTLNGQTSGNGISLTTNSTAKTAGNALYNGTSSGANGTASIASVIYNGTNTNTGTTNTNVVFNGSASGATNNWTFRAEAGNYRSTGAAGFYALNSAGTGGISMAYDNSTIGTITTTGGVRLDLDAASSNILARRSFVVGFGIDFGNAVSLDVYKSASGTSNIQNWRSSGGTVLANVNQSGRFFIGSSTSATALIHLAASTATANTGQIKLDEGTRQTTPENGTINYVSDNIEFVETSTVYTLAKTLTATATLDFDLTAVNYQDLTITVTGAATNDAVSFSVDAAAWVADVTYSATVTAANTVTIRCSRVGGGGAANPGSGTFRAAVIHY